MSKINTVVTDTIRKAKYRVKNAEGEYEVVYLETSADQVEVSAERQFISSAEKAQIVTNKKAIAQEKLDRTQGDSVLAGRLNTVEGTGDGSIKKALVDAKAYTDAEIVKVNGTNSGLADRVDSLESDLNLVDGKIAASKTEAIAGAKTYTDAEIVKVDAAYKAADTKVLSDSKTYTDGEVLKAKTAIETITTALAGRVSVNENEISDIKDLLSNKNNNTIVVNEMEEIVIENPEPKIGDMAYVISLKKAYIFKGSKAVSGLVLPEPPTGWVLFDEITTELDLVNYLKKSEAESTYRKLATKIAEADLATELSTKINAKADKSYVDTELDKKTNEAYVNNKVEEVVSPVRIKSNANEAAIAKEVLDRATEITRVEGLVSTVASDLNAKEAALKAEDVRLNNRINKFATVVGTEQPTGTEAGHVWLQLV